MYIKPYLAKLKYNAEIDHLLDPKDYIPGTILNIHNITIFTYYRVNKKNYNLVFEVDKKTATSGFRFEYLKENGVKPLEIRKFDNKFLFVEKMSKEEMDLFEHATAGYMTLNIYDSKNNLIDVIDIKVLPSSISYEDYINILDDLIRIKNSLIYSENKKINIGKSSLNEQKEYLDEIEKIIKIIERIFENPKKQLTKEHSVESINSIKKLTPKIIIDRKIHPYKTNLSVEKSKENIDIYENRIIKYSLKKMLLTLKRYEKSNLQYLDYIDKRYFILNNKFRDKDYLVYDKIEKNTNNNIENDANNDIENNIKNKHLKNFCPLEEPLLKYEYGYEKFSFSFKYNNETITFKTNNIVKLKYFYDYFKRINSFENVGNADIIFTKIPDTNSNKSELIFDDTVRGLKYNNRYFLRDSNDENIAFDNAISFILNKFNENIFSNLGFIHSIRKKQSNLIEERKNIKQINIAKIRKKINKILKSEQMRQIGDKTGILKETQIFNSDPNYNKVFRLLKKVNQQSNFLSDLSAERCYLKTVPNIYELWCYYKIIMILVSEMKWEISSHTNLITEISKVLETKKEDKKNRTITLKHKTNSEDIYLSLSYEKLTKTKKTPDYTFEFFTVKNNKKEYLGVAYLDAKYRNYKTQGNEQFTYDLETTALEKYYLGKEKNIISSFIVHTDNHEEYTTFGGEKVIRLSDNKLINYKDLTSEEKSCIKTSNEFNSSEKDGYLCVNNKIGSFFFTPSNTDNLKKFIVMLLEYHLKIYDVCWNCGEVKRITIEKQKTRSSFSKIYYRCENCGEFWVKTHCTGTKRKGNHDLLKHIDNYHFLTADWYVACPQCFDGFEPSKNKFNKYKK